MTDSAVSKEETLVKPVEIKRILKEVELIAKKVTKK